MFSRALRKLLNVANKSGWGELGAVLRHVRAWGVTALSARRFPLYLGASREPPFDLVIVDEASQCQIAEILPVLFRAKRALIIGDPMQLGPIGNLSPSQQCSARRNAGITASWLDERCLTSHRYSVFHAAQRAAPATLLLDEHYRCHPRIAEFANQTFYQGRLLVLSAPDPSDVRNESAITWLEVNGAPYRRAGSWANDKEARAIQTKATKLLAQYPSKTIGVISPLRAQKDLLESILPTDPRLSSGTVHTFQGGEQEIILLSLVLGPNMATGTRRWLARPTTARCTM